MSQVRGLEFNSIAPNLLASGADDGEICIWDLVNPLEATHFPPLKVRFPSSDCLPGNVSSLHNTLFLSCTDVQHCVYNHNAGYWIC